MSIQSEATLEAGLIATLQQMDYEYVQIAEEENLQANFKRQLEIHNRKRLAEHGRTGFTAEEFDKILIYLEGGTRFEKAKKLRDLYPLDTADGKRIWVEFLNRQQWCQNELKFVARLVNLPIPLTMYCARHSWASIAKSKNIPLSVISEGMGHDSEETTRIYLASLDTSVIDKANSLILKDL